MKFVYILALAVLLQCTYSQAFIGQILCLLHNAKCTVFYTGAATFCTAQKLVNEADCNNEYQAAAELCDANREVCGW